MPTVTRIQGLVAPLAIGWGLLGFCVFLLSDWNDQQALIGVLMVSQAFCGAIVYQRFRATTAATLPDFLAVYLLFRLLDKTITLAGQILGSDDSDFGFLAEVMADNLFVSTEYLVQAEWVFLLAIVVFTLTWRQLEGRSGSAIWHEPEAKQTWRAYFIASGLYLVVGRFSPYLSFGLTSGLLNFFALGAVAVLLAGTSAYGLGRRRAWLSVAALGPWVFDALQTGMRSELVVALSPLLLVAVRRLNVKTAALLAAFLAFLLLFVFPFAFEWRQANWYGFGREEGASIQTVASRVLAKWEHQGLTETAVQSTASWLQRGSSATQGGLVMQIAARDGFLGPIFFEGLATIFVPRFLWPGKPTYAPGAWFTWYLGKAPSPEQAKTATAMMLPTELYWMMGLLGVVVGIATLAALNFFVWRHLSRRAGTGTVPVIALFGVLLTTISLEGTSTIYAYSSPIIWLIYIKIFDYLDRHLFARDHRHNAGVR